MTQERDQKSPTGRVGLVTALILVIIGSLLGSGAAPGGIWQLFGSLAGAALLVVPWLYHEESVKRSGVRHPYGDGARTIITIASFPILFVGAAMALSSLLEASGTDGSWLVQSAALVGFALGMVFQGRAVRAGRRTAPQAFIFFAYLLFTLVVVGTLSFEILLGGLATNAAPAVGAVFGIAGAFAAWFVYLSRRSA